MTQWSFQPVFDSYLAVVAIVSVLLALLLLGPGFSELSRRRRIVLIVSRLAVILLLGLALLRPTRVSTETRRHPATVILLMDASRSMTVQDAPDGKTRWHAMRAAVEEALPTIVDLTDELEVKLYHFDASAAPVGFTEGEIESARVPDGGQTDIGSSLDDTVRRASGKHLAAVFLLSDGAQRAVAPRVPPQQAARELARRDTPLFAITFGLSRDKTQARDVAVEGMQEEYSGFVNTDQAVRAVVRVQGYVNRDIPVELVVETPAGKTETLGPVLVKATEDGQELPVEIVFTPTEVGEYSLTLRAAEQSGELDTDNNFLPAMLTVRDEGIRMLYVESNLLWREQRDLRKSLGQSPNIQLDFLPILPKQRERWPVDLGPAIDNVEYDVFLIGDVDATALGDEQLGRLAEAVQNGKGLMMIGGYHSFGPGGYAGTPLADVLPIKMDRLERQPFDEPDRTELHWNVELQMIPTRRHFITHLAGTAQNEAAWRALPTLLGANRFSGIKNRAVVLAESTDERPLLVAGEPGGRVLAFAADSTWRWWAGPHREQHKRFWRQAVLWLAGKEETQKDELWMQLDRRRVDPGAELTVTAGLTGPTGEPVEGAALSAVLVSPEGKQSPIRLSPRGDHFTASLAAPKQEGRYSIRLAASVAGAPLDAAEQTFWVSGRDPELGDPAANPRRMAQLAGLTQDAGGKVLAPEQLADQLRTIKKETRRRESEEQTVWQLSDTLPDAWLLLLLLTALLTTEWALRKKWGLV